MSCIRIPTASATIPGCAYSSGSTAGDFFITTECGYSSTVPTLAGDSHGGRGRGGGVAM